MDARAEVPKYYMNTDSRRNSFDQGLTKKGTLKLDIPWKER